VGWFGQTNVTHDGVDAAQSGAIGDSQQSWVETTVAGPGTLNFWWKISSEFGYDFLSFLINGVEQSGKVSGEVDWQQKTVDLPPRNQTLRWQYSKDSNGAVGQDVAWLDQVSFVPNGG